MALTFPKTSRTYDATRRAVKAGFDGIELHGANHYVFDSNTGEVTEAMRAFLAKHAQEPAEHTPPAMSPPPP